LGEWSCAKKKFRSERDQRRASHSGRFGGCKKCSANGFLFPEHRKNDVRKKRLKLREKKRRGVASTGTPANERVPMRIVTEQGLKGSVKVEGKTGGW